MDDFAIVVAMKEKRAKLREKKNDVGILIDNDFYLLFANFTSSSQSKFWLGNKISVNFCKRKEKCLV